MLETLELFSPANLAASVTMPLAPSLIPHDWPYPGLSPQDSARSALAGSKEFVEVVAATIKRQGGATLTGAEDRALLPEDWLELLGRWAHGNITQREAEKHCIDVRYISHDGGGGFHFQYSARQGSQS